MYTQSVGKQVRLTDHQRSTVVRLYQEGQSAYKIAELFGCSEMPIYACLKTAGIERRDRSACQRKCSFNEHFFDTIETEAQAYWLGFLAADGYVCRPRRVLATNLAAKDREHLVKLSEAVETKLSLFDYVVSGHPMVRLTLISEQLLDSLEKLGVGPDKAASRAWPELSLPLYRHYVRGYFDGDGTFRSNESPWKKKYEACALQASVGFVSPQAITAAIKAFFEKELEIAGSHFFEKRSKASWRLRYGGNPSCLAIVNLLYEGAVIFLPRKRDLVLAHYRALPKYASQLHFG